MSFSTLLPYLCNIYRASSSTFNEFNEEIKTSTTVLSNVKCNVELLTSDELKEAGISGDNIVAAFCVFMDYGVDIKAKDEISFTGSSLPSEVTLTDQTKLTVHSVTDPMGRHHHLEVYVKLSGGVT